MLEAMTDMTSPNIQVVEDAYEAFGRGDIDAVVEAMHPEIAWHEAEHSPWHAPGGHHGPTAVLANVFARIPDFFDDFTVDPQAIHDAGATVIVEGRYRAKAAGTNEPLDAEACHVWTVRDGKIAAFRQYTDTCQFREVTSPHIAS